VDPFSTEFEDPHAIHDTLREAGPLVWLDKWGVWRGRYAEVHASSTTLTFCSSRGVGLSDFARKPWRPQSIIPRRTSGAYQDAVGARPVLSPTAMKGVREHFTAMAAAKVDELLARGVLTRLPICGGHPLSVFPMRWA
jgi:hypothetical protein